jgi:hypothetical protein
MIQEFFCMVFFFGAPERRDLQDGLFSFPFSMDKALRGIVGKSQALSVSLFS